MNLPIINNKMKNLNNQFKQDTSLTQGGFGLGIQVFKIESVKNIDNNNKSKNRTAIKNIENPNQTHHFKPPLLPKPKKLPSLQKSSSQINPKQRLSAFINTKIQMGGHHTLTDKIIQRKHPNIQSNTIVTPVSYSMRKKVGVSTQKTIISNQNTKPSHAKNFIIQKQKPGRAIGVKLNQTAPPETMYKPQQLYYEDYRSEHEVLLKFYLQYQNSCKQVQKQIKQLKKLKQNEFDSETYDKIEYLQSLEGRISTVIDTLEKKQFDQRLKDIANDKRSKKIFNTIVPISGFQLSQYDSFQYDTIQTYQNGNYSGCFKVNDYQNVDFAPPVTNQNKDDQQQEDDN